MNSNLKSYFIVAALAAAAVIVLVILPKTDEPGEPGRAGAVASFEDCLEAGYPVMESFPRQCRAPEGRVFVEDIAEHVEVRINEPQRGGLVASPLTVSGEARGPWFFEANLPVTLKDQNGNILAQAGAQAQGEWMTEDFVGFQVELRFDQPATDYGVLVIEKDNPSGLPENDASYAIPVRFR